MFRASGGYGSMESFVGDRGSAGRTLQDSRARDVGQAVVEFAVVLPLLLTMLLLAVDFGRLFYTYIAVNNAAREGVFVAATRAADSDYEAEAYAALVVAAARREANTQTQTGEGQLFVAPPICFAPGASTTMDCHEASRFAGGVGNQVRVTTSRTFSFLTPLVSQFFADGLTLSASATGPVLNPLDTTITAATGATGSPEPSSDPEATPTGSSHCQVPDFYHTYWHDIGSLQIWHDEAGFTGHLIDLTGGKKIKSQTLVAGSVVPCSSNMIVSRL